MSGQMKMLVLDFDGTVTDAEAEGAPFRDGYLEDIAILTGRPKEEVLELAAGFEAEVQQNQDAHGWLYNGHIVAPATVDPYLRIMPVARMIFDACGSFPVEADRTRLLDGILYKYNYQKTEIAFKKEAKEVLLQLRDQEVYILSNSHTEPIQHKLRVLGAEDDGSSSLEWMIERVFGRAKKYVVESDFTQVPETLDMPGLSRPVLLRRPLYYQSLEALRQKHDIEWGDILVVGDIFELDLALPLAMGARVGVVKNDFTPAYEMAFLQDHPRGFVFDSLREVLPLLS